MDIVYKSSSSGNAYPLFVEFSWLKYSDVVFAPDFIESLCQKGCRNYGYSGGCPPFSPRFNTFAKKENQYLLIISKFDSVYKTEKVQKSSNRAIHWKFQDVIVAHFLDKLGRAIRTRYDSSIFLGTGYCMGCTGKKCSYKLKEPCRNPQKRTFSMEATGINVVKTVWNNMHERFYWYTRTNLSVPYLMKAILLIFPQYQEKGEIEQYLNLFLDAYRNDLTNCLF